MSVKSEAISWDDMRKELPIDSQERLDVARLERLRAERSEVSDIMQRLKPEDIMTKMSMMGKLKALDREIALHLSKAS